MAPPLRTDADVQAILAGLSDGTLEVIATDHAPHAPEKKMRELDQAPNGIIGLETLLPVCVKALIEPGHLTWPQLIEKLTINPAKVLGIDRGTLKPGADRRRDDHRPGRGVDHRPEPVPLEEPQLPLRRLEGARPGRDGAGRRGGQVRAGGGRAAIIGRSCSAELLPPSPVPSFPNSVRERIAKLLFCVQFRPDAQTGVSRTAFPKGVREREGERGR